MRSIDNAVMRTVEGGATYSKRCSKCGWIYRKNYNGFFGYLWAKHVVDSAVRSCRR